MNLVAIKNEAVEKTIVLKNSMYQVKVLADFSGDRELSRATANALEALSLFVDAAKGKVPQQPVGEVTDE